MLLMASTKSIYLGESWVEAMLRPLLKIGDHNLKCSVNKGNYWAEVAMCLAKSEWRIRIIPRSIRLDRQVVFFLFRREAVMCLFVSS